MKQGPFKMKAKSPMLKALIGNQGNLNAGLRAAIEAAPTKMKKESMATMKKESSMKMKKESSMKMMDKKSPAKRVVKVDGKLVRETKEMRKKRLANTSGSRRKAQLEKLKNNPGLNLKEIKIKEENEKKKENEKKLLEDYNNPKRKDPLADLTGTKKPNVKKQKTTVNLVEKNPKKINKKVKIEKKKIEKIKVETPKDELIKAGPLEEKKEGNSKKVSERNYRKNRKGGESQFQYMNRIKKEARKKNKKESSMKMMKKK